MSLFLWERELLKQKPKYHREIRSLRGKSSWLIAQNALESGSHVQNGRDDCSKCIRGASSTAKQAV